MKMIQMIKKNYEIDLLLDTFNNSLINYEYIEIENANEFLSKIINL